MSPNTIMAEVAAVLDSATLSGQVLHLPPALPRPVYEAVDKVLAYAGSVYRPRRGHVFPGGVDVMQSIAQALAAGALENDNPHDFFPTPTDVADEMVRAALPERMAFNLNNPTQDYRIRVLEPSAGRGALLEALFRVVPRDRVEVVAFEIDPRHRRHLEALSVHPDAADFLTAPIGQPVDLVLMNPPFAQKGYRRAWLAHIVRALHWLKPGGAFGAIVPGGLLDQCRQNVDPALVDLVARVHADGGIEEVRPMAFNEAPRGIKRTTVSTAIIHMDTPDPDDHRISGPIYGYPNWATYHTALVIDNSEPVHSQLSKLRTEAEIRRFLVAQRPALVAAFAPWTPAVDQDFLIRLYLAENTETASTRRQQPQPIPQAVAPVPTDLPLFQHLAA